MDDGIELGWTTSSSLGMGVKHIFNGVTNGRNFEAAGPVAAPDKKGEAGKAQALKMTRPDDDRHDRQRGNQSRSRSNTRLHLQVRGCPDGPHG